jgi:hypothetical protein
MALDQGTAKLPAKTRARRRRNAPSGPPRRAGSPLPEARPDIEALTRPLLKALATLADLESTYLTVFDWDRREQEVRYVFSAGETQVERGTTGPHAGDVVTGSVSRCDEISKRDRP